MKQKLMKLGTLALAACILTTCLAACGGTPSSAPASTVPAAESTAPAQPADGAEPAESTDGSGMDIQRIAMLLPGVITDQSWNTSGYNGLMDLESQGYECAYTESVPTPDIESTFRTYADVGYQLIIGHGAQFGDAAITVGPDYPDQFFFVVGKMPVGATCPNNVGFVDIAGHEISYLCGTSAAQMSETGIVGFVGGQASESQWAFMYGFEDGVHFVDDSVQVVTLMSGDYNDSALGYDAAITMIEQGADVIMHTANVTGLGVLQACAEKGVYAIGYGGDQSEIAPDAVITSLEQYIPPVISALVGRIADGTFSGVWKVGLNNPEIAHVTGYANWVPAEVVAKCDEIQNEIASGTLVVTGQFEERK